MIRPLPIQDTIKPYRIQLSSRRSRRNSNNNNSVIWPVHPLTGTDQRP